MKCTIFLFTFHFYMCAGHACFAYTRERAHVLHTIFCVSMQACNLASKMGHRLPSWQLARSSWSVAR